MADSDHPEDQDAGYKPPVKRAARTARTRKPAAAKAGGKSSAGAGAEIADASKPATRRSTTRRKRVQPAPADTATAAAVATAGNTAAEPRASMQPRAVGSYQASPVRAADDDDDGIGRHLATWAPLLLVGILVLVFSGGREQAPPPRPEPGVPSPSGSAVDVLPTPLDPATALASPAIAELPPSDNEALRQAFEAARIVPPQAAAAPAPPAGMQSVPPPNPWAVPVDAAIQPPPPSPASAPPPLPGYPSGGSLFNPWAPMPEQLPGATSAWGANPYASDGGEAVPEGYVAPTW